MQYAIKRNDKHYVRDVGPFGVDLSWGVERKWSHEDAVKICDNLNARGIGKFEVVEVINE